jgi:hypothetical protein
MLLPTDVAAFLERATASQRWQQFGIVHHCITRRIVFRKPTRVRRSSVGVPSEATGTLKREIPPSESKSSGGGGGGGEV